MTKDSKNDGSNKGRTGSKDSDPFFGESIDYSHKVRKEELNTHVSNSMKPPPNPNPKKDRE